MPIQITGLTPGQHTLELVRSTRFGSFLSRVISKNFYLRAGYDVDITVNSSGYIQTTESRIRDYSGYQRRYRNAMSDQDFNYLLNNIRYMRRRGRVTAINNAFTNSSNHFTTAQARVLISMTYSESDRLDLAKASYPTITDPENFSQISLLLNSQSNKMELDNYIREYDNNNTYDRDRDRYDRRNNGNGYNRRIQMSDVDFNRIYDNVRNQFGIGVKMSALVDVFNNSNYYFTSLQARQLIQLVSDEDNRLELAKSSYDNIVDPENFNQLNDLFLSQSRRNELAEYARTHSYNR